MVKIPHNAMNHRFALGALYVLLFAGLSLVVVGLSIQHWIANNFGLKAMLACSVVYIGFMASLVWSINKINEAFPALYLPPSGVLSSSVSEIEETMHYDEADFQAATMSKASEKMQS